MSSTYYKPTTIIPTGSFTYNSIDWTTSQPGSNRTIYRMDSTLVSSSNAILNYLTPSYTPNGTVYHEFNLLYGTYILDFNCTDIAYSFKIDFRVSANNKNWANVLVNNDDYNNNFINIDRTGSNNNNHILNAVTYNTLNSLNYANFTVTIPYQAINSCIILLRKTG
jgi:hypothetical protein